MLNRARGIFTVWEQIIENDGYKVISEEIDITRGLIQRNRTHLSISGDSLFARGPMVQIIGLDG